MKNIQNYKAEKYASCEYQEVEQDIYQMEDEDGDDLFVTSLSFEQEPEYKEGPNAGVENLGDKKVQEELDKVLSVLHNGFMVALYLLQSQETLKRK